MYYESKAIRVDPVRTRRRGRHRHRRLPRRRRLDPCLLRRRGTRRTGSTASCRPKSLTSKTILSAACANACQGAGPGERRSCLGGPRGDGRRGDATSGRPVAPPVLRRSPHHADPGQGARVAQFNRAVYQRLKPGGLDVIVDHAAAVGSARATLGHCIELSLHPFARRRRRPASYWTRKAPCSQTRVIRTRSSVSIPSTKGETDRFVYRFVKP